MRLKELFSFISVIFMVSALTAQSQDGPYIPKGQFLPAPEIKRSAAFYERLEKNSSTQIFSEEFETGKGAWTTSGSWQVGNPTSGLEYGNNSANLAATNLSGDYNKNANDWLISPQIALPGDAGEIFLKFYEWFALESGYDYGRVKISTDDGSNWTQLHSSNGSSNWRETVISLTTYKGEDILLGFNLMSDGSVVGPGWFIDNVVVERFDPTPLEATLVALSSQLFPLIYMNVAVNSFGQGISTLNQSNFQVFENGSLHTNLFEVIPPEAGGGSRIADIVFLMDNSGSMSPYQNAVRDNVIAFVNQLMASDIDFALGLCRFGQSANNGNPILEDAGQLTQDPIYFRDNVWLRNVIDGWREPGYFAITQSAAGFNFRPNSQRVFIIIMDETPNQGGATQQEAIDACLNNNINLFAMINNEAQGLRAVATATNGAWYNITDPFGPILDEIGAAIASNYIVRYSSNNPDCDDVLRNVEISVNYDGEQATATGSYMPCQAPVMYLTDDTAELPNEPWDPNTQFTIEVNIIDNHPPFVNNVMLFYKNSSSLIYQHITMTNTGGNIWSGIIPGDDTTVPGIDYYITASDGQATYSLPSVNPATNPYQIAILPNVAPVITHDIIATASPGTNIPVSAVVVDNTDNVEEVRLYYRRFGQILFQVVDMNNTGGDNYYAQIPSAYVTTDGVQYYIKATDDYGVSSSVGSFDDPIFITVSFTPLVPISNWALYFGFILIVSFIIFRFRKLFQ